MIKDSRKLHLEQAKSREEFHSRLVTEVYPQDNNILRLLMLVVMAPQSSLRQDFSRAKINLKSLCGGSR